MSKTNFEVQMKHLKVRTGEMKLIKKFYLCFNNLSEL